MEEKKFAENIYDILIIGGGPAGLTAGLYASRARKKTVLLESLSVMGQAQMTDVIENYPGIERTGGFELIENMKKQARAFGLSCEGGTVTNIFSREEKGTVIWQAETDSGTREALSLIVASGACPKKLEIPGEEEFSGRGVSYCGTCDAAFFRDKDVVVVGGGNTAVEEAIFLTKFAKKVMIIHRRDRLRAVKILQEQVFSNDKIEFVWNSFLEEIIGTDKVEKVRTKNVKTGKDKEILCDGVFIFAGWKPNTGFLGEVLALDEKRHIVIDDNMGTGRKGLFACGDCCRRPLHQIITACGDGAIAAQSAQHYVEGLKGTAYE